MSGTSNPAGIRCDFVQNMPDDPDTINHLTAPASNIHIVLIDPWLVTRRSLVYLLEAMAEAPTVEAVASPASATNANPDLVIANLHSTHISASGVGRRLGMQGNKRHPPLVVISDHGSPSLAEEAVHIYGAQGFVTTSQEPAVLLAALRLVLAGGTYVPAELLSGSTISIGSSGAIQEASAVERFTAREHDVLRLLREAKPNKIIAHQLRISENTAKVHVRNIMRKLRATNRTQVAILAR